MKLEDIYSYNPENGEIRFKIDRHARKVKGMIAGWVKTDNKRQTSYREMRVDGKTVKAHRLAWRLFYGFWPVGIIDHINGDGLDNRIENLRDVDKFDSAKNKPIQRNNTSGVVGVNFHKPSGKWVAKISSMGKRITIGYFETIDEAAKARRDKEIELSYHSNHGRKQSKLKSAEK